MSGWGGGAALGILHNICGKTSWLLLRIGSAVEQLLPVEGQHRGDRQPHLQRRHQDREGRKIFTTHTQKKKNEMKVGKSMCVQAKVENLMLDCAFFHLPRPFPPPRPAFPRPRPPSSTSCGWLPPASWSPCSSPGATSACTPSPGAHTSSSSFLSSVRTLPTYDPNDHNDDMHPSSKTAHSDQPCHLGIHLVVSHLFKMKKKIPIITL